ncbi:response regulator [Ktedonosporobacter rubrisoli]|uniref:Response regulator n=1 Tax=Ktedonosporobacter rubrisoli TaxID=2509675 RepID=A0A4P6JVN3_KTERU|nr:response regulator [Ktedonosporobacter rubrisoli]QBD79433.1 response regulator [Ktedonosporobacter rubrisoli]
MSQLIMVIDDSPVVRKIIGYTLMREGHTVVAFPDGYKAIRWLASPQGQLPSVLFLDLVLPRMNGYAIARYLKAHPSYKSITIVMISRNCGLIDRLKGRLAGASAYLGKPFRTKDLLAICGKARPVQALARVSSG